MLDQDKHDGVRTRRCIAMESQGIFWLFAICGSGMNSSWSPLFLCRFITLTCFLRHTLLLNPRLALRYHLFGVPNTPVRGLFVLFSRLSLHFFLHTFALLLGKTTTKWCRGGMGGVEVSWKDSVVGLCFLIHFEIYNFISQALPCSNSHEVNERW